MKTKIIIFRSKPEEIMNDFLKFAKVAHPYVRTKKVNVFISKRMIETPTMQFFFKSNNDKARDGLSADITVPYDPVIMAHSKFNRRDCNLRKIFWAFRMDLENTETEIAHEQTK